MGYADHANDLLYFPVPPVMIKFFLMLLVCLPLFGGEHEKLLIFAKKWELPQPHPDSKLVKIWSYYNSTGDYYSLGFVEPATPKKALVGFEWRDISVKTSHPPIIVDDIAKLDLKFVSVSSPFGSPNGTNDGLLTAIQLLRKGHPEVAGRLLEKSLQSDSGHRRSSLLIKGNQAPELMLAPSCLAAASNAITRPKPDFAVIKRRIETLIADQPALKSKTTDWLLSALTASVNHPPSKPGTLEALIDDYLMSGMTEGGLVGRQSDNPARKALVTKGFEAIPALIEQLDDKRMTNHLMQGFNNFSSYPMTADLVINVYLQSFANDEMDSNWLERQKGYKSKKEAVEAWWAKASAMGEKEYVRRMTLTKTEKNKRSTGSELLQVANDRYPEFLPEFYTELLGSKQYSHEIASLLAHHPKIPLKTRKELFLKGVEGGQDEHRNAALRELLKIDRPAGEALLLELIKKGPKTTQGEYWTDQNAGLTRFVSESADLEIWQATDAYLKRALLGMRMELISNLRPPKEAPREVLEIFLGIFDRYADDQTLRKNSSSKKFGGPGAGFPYDNLELRNFIHIHYGGWLQIELRPPDRRKQSPHKWEAFRKEVFNTMNAYRR